MEMRDLHGISSRLSGFVEEFALHLGRSERRRWCKAYLSGLLLNGNRKSIQSIADRIGEGNAQAIQQFVNQSPWSYEDILKALRKALSPRFLSMKPLFILNDWVIPKKGRYSVGVAYQSCGASGRRRNCQCLVTWQGSTEAFRMPLATRLHLPEEWIKDPRRLDLGGVPEDKRVFREKWETALDLLDDLRSEMMPEAILMDSGYGSNRDFLRELDKRGLPFVARIRERETFWDGATEAAPSHPDRGKIPPGRHPLASDSRPRLRSASEWGRFLFSDPRNIESVGLSPRHGNVSAFATMPVHESVVRPFHRIGPRRRLLVEKSKGGGFDYHVSNLPAPVSALEILRMAHSRREIAQEYRRLRDELGFDHFEGRSWTGLHHHVALCFMALDFLQLLRLDSERRESAEDPPGSI